MIAILVLALGYTYMGSRLIVPAQLPAPWNYVAWSVIIALFFLVLVSVYLQMKRIDNPVTHLLMWITYVSMGFFSFLFTVIVIRDLLWVGGSFVARLLPGLDPAPEAVDTGRRIFLMRVMSAGILALVSTLTGIGIYEARKRPGIVNISVPLNNLPAAFEGFRIVQITDIHAGLTVARDFVATITEMVNELKPDLIAFTGDFADGSVSNLRNDVEPFGELKAPYGRFFVTGNHEYYSGVEQWVAEARRLGFTALMNEHRMIEKDGEHILLAGVTDVTGGHYAPSHRSNPTAALAGTSSNGTVKILMAHQPRSLYEASKLGIDFQLSGHTHGGQFFPWNFAATIGQPFISGLHLFEKTFIYVSKGTGYWGPPIRLGARSEITVHTLTRGTEG
ncbi:MAG TPA: metallophosphoesterase [Bacteroidota bacterium]|nr:metallophosphoesterase [Bacteroidota bacterium]